VTDVLILKTAALGDVLRTTSVLPGLAATCARLRVTWLTAPGAIDLVRTHPLVARVVAADPGDRLALERARRELADVEWDWLLSFDDEEPLCALASGLCARRLSGAHLAPDGRRAYTRDVAPWFDMGLLSVHGKAAADRLKIENTRSHARIYAGMLGLPMARPELHLPAEPRERARALWRERGLDARRPVVGLNTGAGGRWTSKQLPVERVVALIEGLAAELPGEAAFLVLGGENEAARNRAILDGAAARGLGARAIDAGVRHPLLDFAGLVGLCDVLVTSDSLALHVAVALGVRCVAFFAPTSAAEIELYGRGEKIVSTAPDACSYRPDADTSTLTAARLAEAVVRQLGRARELAEPVPGAAPAASTG
jgi:heptosyltransferase-2